MKVLFVCSGNSPSVIGAVVANQAEALTSHGVKVAFYPIKGKGFMSYIRHSFLLKKHLMTNSYDIIHAHYILSAFVATLSGGKPLVVSLMGSDLNIGKLALKFVSFLNKNRWKNIIVKSDSMQKILNLRNVHIIPNGVNLSLFYPVDGHPLRSKFGFSEVKKTLLFIADPLREVKNFSLAEKAYGLLPKGKFELQVKYNLSRHIVPQILNAADIILLTSCREGSPNIIKEAMACNKPIVATDVGDIAWLFGNEPGHFLTSFDPSDIAEKIILAYNYLSIFGQTKGRERILEIGLDSSTISQRLIALYKSVLN